MKDPEPEPRHPEVLSSVKTTSTPKPSDEVRKSDPLNGNEKCPCLAADYFTNQRNDQFVSNFNTTFPDCITLFFVTNFDS